MELVVEEISAQKRKLNITIPEDVVSSRVDAAYNKLNRQLRMPGFRPGKIPRNVLEKQIPIQSLSEMFQELLQDYYEKALNETGIVPVGPPEIDHSQMQDVKKGAPLSFSVTLDIKPNVKVKGYKGLKFKKREPEVSDHEVECAVQNILVQYGNLEHHEDGHEAQINDFLCIDFEGSLDGVVLENGSAKDFKLRIGDKRMIPGFEDQLIGHKLGEEFDVKVALPQNWDNKIRRVSMPVPGGKDEDPDDIAVFKVKIKEMKYQVLPELNDELAQKEGFGTVKDLRRAVKTNLQTAQEQKEEVRIKEEIFNHIVGENDLVPTEAAIKNELRFMIEGMKFQIEQSGTKLEDSGFEPEKAEKEWRERAMFNSKGYTLLEAIAAQENIHITQNELEDEFRVLAEQTKQKVEDVQRKILNNPDSLRQTTSKLLGIKIMNFIYSHCEFEFVKGGPVADNETGVQK